jgi:hypothetical protein
MCLQQRFDRRSKDTMVMPVFTIQRPYCVAPDETTVDGLCGLRYAVWP